LNHRQKARNIMELSSRPLSVLMAVRRRSWLLTVILLIHPGIVAAQGGAPPDQQASPGCGLRQPMPPFPAGAEQVAREIDILPLVRRVRDLAATCAPVSQEEMWLRQQITEAVLAASLDVDETIAEIALEQDRLSEVQDRLTSAKNNKVNTLTLAGILVGSGTSAIGTGMGLNNSLAKAGDWVQVFGGTGGIVLSILALRARGGTAYLGVAPNMLASLFGREPEVGSVYPQDVWTYLNTAPVDNPRVHVPWTQELIAQWVNNGRIGPPTAPASQAKIDRLTSAGANREKLSIGDPIDRKGMLKGVRTRVSLMNRDLRDLTKAVTVPVR
jgi:hypothetical protein